ncbi:hypothetical protein B0H13DRAFT_1892096 [Mycena leptocephala]|nr:hypothetical protein B0H13DRAFT_1892096 [Mycena leptocephala]
MPFDVAPYEYDAVVRVRNGSGSGGRVGTWQWLWAARARRGREGVIDHRANGWVRLVETGLGTRCGGVVFLLRSTASVSKLECERSGSGSGGEEGGRGGRAKRQKFIGAPRYLRLARNPPASRFCGVIHSTSKNTLSASSASEWASTHASRESRRWGASWDGSGTRRVGGKRGSGSSQAWAAPRLSSIAIGSSATFGKHEKDAMCEEESVGSEVKTKTYNIVQIVGVSHCNGPGPGPKDFLGVNRIICLWNRSMKT